VEEMIASYIVGSKSCYSIGHFLLFWPGGGALEGSCLSHPPLQLGPNAALWPQKNGMGSR